MHTFQLVSERYSGQGDSLSVAILCEAAVDELGALLPTNHEGLELVRKMATEAAAALTPNEMRVVGIGSRNVGLGHGGMMA